MGKKSKSSSFASKYRAREAAPEQAFDPKKSRHRRLETEDDAYAEDGEDAFHRNRDTVLFEDDGRRGGVADDDVSDPDEIYGLNLPSGGSESDQSDEDDQMDDDDEEDDLYDKNGNLKQVKPSKKVASDEPRGRFAKTANPDQDLISDDDSASGDDAPASDEDASDAEPAPAGSDSDDEETWAPGSYHASRRAPGEADSEDDEALELEANEARRLQQIAKGRLGGEDYGFDAEGEAEGTAEEVRKAAREKGRLEEDEESGEGGVAGGKMTEEEAIAHLVRNSPETLALLDDFAATAQRLESVEKDLEVVRKGGDDGKEHPALAIMELEHQALSTYLPTLAFYFSLLLQPVPPAALVTKVVYRLSALRKSLATMEELDLTSAPIDDYEDEDVCGSDCDEDHDHVHADDSEDEEEDEDEEMLASEMWDLNGAADLSEDEDAEMLARMDGESDSEEEDEDEELEDDEEMMDEDGYDSEAEAEMEENLMKMTHEELELLKEDMAGDEDADMLIATVNRVQRRKAGFPSDEDESDDAPAPLPTKKSNKRQPAPAVIPALAPLASSSKLAKRPARSAVDDDFVDPQALSRTDASDKASKKHSLRFHVSQVNQRQHKRENANAARIGGDDDLPRRSKERSRREVLKRQEHGGQAGEALDGAEWDEEDRKMAAAVKGKAAEVDAGGDDDGDYYDLVKMSKGEERAAKKARYDEEKLAERDEIMALASGEAGVGPRAASKMILKNKGLTPRRKKENRNSRVKKRLQYDKAQKKVASMKPTYKGPGAGANYSGETSGISSRNVRAIKLAK